MYSKEKLLEMVASENTSDRYEALEAIRISQQSYPEYIHALEKATQDPDPEIARRACLALGSEVHSKMAIQMRLALPFLMPASNEVVTNEALQGAQSLPKSVSSALMTSMLREIRSWGLWSIGLGVIHLFALGLLNSSWGMLLILVGLASLIFKTSSMFVIYAVTIGWAAIGNISTLTPSWILFSVLQLYFSVRIILSYQRFRKQEQTYLENAEAKSELVIAVKRTSNAFPWIGLIFGCVSIFGFVGYILLVIGLAVTGFSELDLPNYFLLIGDILLNMGVLGFALGLASVLARFRPKAVSIIALVSGLFTMVIFIGMSILSMLI